MAVQSILRKGLSLWSKIRIIFIYRKLIKAGIKTFRPILRITDRRIMKYVSMVTIFTIVFGLSFWSTDFNSAHADSTSVGASKDSWVDQAHTSDNHGDSTELKVKSKNNSDNRRLLIKFDLPSLPSGYVIESAILTLYMKDAPSDDRTYGIYRTTGSDWVEGNGDNDNNPLGELTWSNKPSIASSPTSTVTTGTTNNVYKSWDVTSDVTGMYVGSYNNYGWTLRDEAESNPQSRESKFRSKEYIDSDQHPKLDITYHVVPQGSISGYKFNDLDGDGSWDQEGENPEPGLANWTIILSNGDETTTNQNGYYTFEGLESDDYTVCEEVEEDWSQTYPNSDSENIADADIYESCDEESDSLGKYGYEVEIDEDQAEEVNFGNFKKPTITVYKYNDIDGNGDYLDKEEPALQNWTMAVGRVGMRQQPEQPAGPDNQIPIEIVAMSLTGLDGSVRFTIDRPGDYKAFEAQQDGWSATSPEHIDSFFDITYDLKSIADGDPDFDLLSIGDPDFDLLRSSFFDIFVEISGQNINFDNQERPLVFLNHLIPSPTPTPSESPTPTMSPSESPTPTLSPSESPTPTPDSTPTPTPTPENNGGSGGGGGGAPGGIIIDGPGSNSGGGTVAGASTTPTPTPPSTSPSAVSSVPNGLGSSTSSTTTLTSEVTGENPTPTPSETPAPSESPLPEDSDLFAQFLNSLLGFFLWLSRRL